MFMKRDELLLFVANAIAKELEVNREDINPDTHLVYYGLNSIHAISLTGELESKLKVKFDYAALIRLKNLNGITDFLFKQMTEQSTPDLTMGQASEPLFSSIEQQLIPLSDLELYFGESAGFSTPFITIKEKKYLNFSSYNYLGFAHDEDIINATCAALCVYGTSVSASRVVGGQKTIHRRLEQTIAKFLHVDDALVFNSGHSTNLTTIGHLMDSGDLILLDELSHNSLVLGAKLSGATLKFFNHNSTYSLHRLLTEHHYQYKKTLVVTEGVFSMDGDIAPLNEYVALKNQFNFFLYVDEAHSLGVLGASGAGIGEYYSINRSAVDIWMGTLSKAMASCGGYIAGSSQLINYLKYTCPGFVYSCGLSPADTAAALTSFEKLQESSSRVQHLHHLSNYLTEKLKKHSIDFGLNQGAPIIPIIVGSKEAAIRLCGALRKRNIYLHAIVPPVISDEQSRLRVFINYSHTYEDIDFLVRALNTELEHIAG
ncbi:aminotransferase class I/II-fold pyridoxal phosphate-dependent enzyme [Legionella pneumophila]|uniref:aminotransferase class I/II-fold pyridoxal phosphate-dependent enzyme n=1 Tax=Legionella pneumophila TaxID=446 RepID=UPI00077873C0|nr:aminotransferase class I/II-fold pyridoxal phosphate-dependent enzyme [Legionella pneumophila]HAT8606372.1 aminotransferase class I/II-fold pyridoxal phosphate-dependent enzyme [Legionella pneumophila]